MLIQRCLLANLRARFRKRLTRGRTNTTRVRINARSFLAKSDWPRSVRQKRLCGVRQPIFAGLMDSGGVFTSLESCLSVIASIQPRSRSASAQDAYYSFAAFSLCGVIMSSVYGVLYGRVKTHYRPFTTTPQFNSLLFRFQLFWRAF
jgi:hypothetical protein